MSFLEEIGQGFAKAFTDPVGTFTDAGKAVGLGIPGAKCRKPDEADAHVVLRTGTCEAAEQRGYYCDGQKGSCFANVLGLTIGTTPLSDANCPDGWKYMGATPTGEHDCNPGQRLPICERTKFPAKIHDCCLGRISDAALCRPGYCLEKQNTQSCREVIRDYCGGRMEDGTWLISQKGGDPLCREWALSTEKGKGKGQIDGAVLLYCGAPESEGDELCACINSDKKARAIKELELTQEDLKNSPIAPVISTLACFDENCRNKVSYRTKDVADLFENCPTTICTQFLQNATVVAAGDVAIKNICGEGDLKTTGGEEGTGSAYYLPLYGWIILGVISALLIGVILALVLYFTLNTPNVNGSGVTKSASNKKK